MQKKKTIPTNPFGNYHFYLFLACAEGNVYNLFSFSETPIPSSFIRFPIVASTCLTIVLKVEDIDTLPLDLAGFNLWHRKADTSDYPVDPTGTIVLPNRSIVITELAPSTSYKFKLVAFNHAKVKLDSWEVKETTTCCSKDPKGIEVRKQPSFDLSNPSSEGGESNNSAAVYADLNKSPERESDSDFEGCENPDLNGSGLGSGSGSDQVTNVKESPETADMNGVSASALDEEAVLNIIPLPKTSTANGAVIRLISTRPVTPGQTENGKADNVLLQKPDREPGSSSNKWVSGHNDGCMEGSYEYCVKVIRRLECEGLIESNFRVKFLTWFSLRATPQERKIVNVYVDTLIDDPVSLAGQLSDTFSDRIYSKGLLVYRVAFACNFGIESFWTG
ncbi:vernalization5/VIN3-like protein [Rhynchospora pubera]|uniref:Vernalization5/VIN3-like protein n=1 Tax=Rhynchospora pubera TaxID=906938 RepID=A0AAV8ALJ6_9POAL|nr:vernalization5/VIN3-like protein [Rhynchospora pubera]